MCQYESFCNDIILKQNKLQYSLTVSCEKLKILILHLQYRKTLLHLLLYLDFPNIDLLHCFWISIKCLLLT